MHNGSPSEDVVFWETPFGNFSKSAIFGVCDGHLGNEVSIKIPELFPRILSDLIGGVKASLFEDDETIATTTRDFLYSSFLELDKSLIVKEAGSTATVLLAEKMTSGDEIKLQVANVGDSLAILINTQTGSVTDLTADHRVVSEAERKRLEQLGAPLTNNNTRLCMLNLARALGDSQIKDLNVGLVAEPFISPVVHLATNKEHLIVMASDGLWDFVNKREVASLAMKLVQEDWEGVRAFGAALINLTSQRRGPTDDISVFVARV